jgi:ketosteroid isomerase-like protein
VPDPVEAVALLPQACRDTARAMSEENVEILRRLYEQWASGDLSPDFFDPEVEYSRIGAETPDMEGRWLGLDELRTAMLEYLQPFSDLRIEAERIIDLGGDRVLVLSRQTAHGKQSGAPIDHQFGDEFTPHDGKIVRLDSYWNRAEALEAAGLRE